MTDVVSEQPGGLPAGDAAREGIVEQLRAELGEAVVEVDLEPGVEVWVRVATEAWREAGRVARDVLGCRYFGFLSAIDWLPSPFGRGEDDPDAPPPERRTEIVQGRAGGSTRFQVFARVVNVTDMRAVTLKVDVPETGDPAELAIDSWTPLYAGADWHERETHEMFGITFRGHPDLRNLYLPTEFEGYPLRKDYPLLARIVKPWPGIVDVEQLPGEGAEETAAAGGDEGTA